MREGRKKRQYECIQLNSALDENAWMEEKKKSQAESILRVSPKTATQFNLYSSNYGIIRFKASTLNDRSQHPSKNIYVKQKKKKKLTFSEGNNRLLNLPGKSR